MTLLKYLYYHKTELSFLSIFVLFLFFMNYLDFRSSLVEPFKEGMEDNNETSHIVQIGKNSSTINSLREKIDKINPDKIEDALKSMKKNIKENSDNIELIKQAQDKMNEDAE